MVLAGEPLLRRVAVVGPKAPVLAIVLQFFDGEIRFGESDTGIRIFPCRSRKEIENSSGTRAGLAWGGEELTIRPCAFLQASQTRTLSAGCFSWRFSER